MNDTMTLKKAITVVVVFTVVFTSAGIGFFKWYYGESRGSWQEAEVCHDVTMWVPKAQQWIVDAQKEHNEQSSVQSIPSGITFTYGESNERH